MLTAYLCYSLQDGVTMIGFFNLWSAIFFIARTLQFNMLYFAPNLVIAAAYMIRVVYFFLMVRNETTQTKEDYFSVNKWSTFGLIAGGILFVSLSWAEWSVAPTWQVASWITIGGIEAYHWFVIKAFAGITVGSFQSYTKDVDQSAPVVTPVDTVEEDTQLVVEEGTLPVV